MNHSVCLWIFWSFQYNVKSLKTKDSVLLRFFFVSLFGFIWLMWHFVWLKSRSFALKTKPIHPSIVEKLTTQNTQHKNKWESSYNCESYGWYEREKEREGETAREADRLKKKIRWHFSAGNDEQRAWRAMINGIFKFFNYLPSKWFS